MSWSGVISKVDAVLSRRPRRCRWPIMENPTAILNRRLISGVSAMSALTCSLAFAAGGQAAPTPAGGVTPPPANATVDYQLGEAYTPPAGVTVVSRDHTDAPAAGIYNICYINAFQAQTDATAWWRKNHNDLLLKDSRGREIKDKDWNEILLDTSTAAKREALVGIVGEWMTDCAAAGFKAVEPDNMDSYERSKGQLSMASNLAYLQLLASRAHAAGLAIAQKNTTALGSAGKAAGLDFAVAEECAAYDECGYYTGVYGDRVIDIEYKAKKYNKACAAIGATISVVQRDRDLTAPGSRTYVYKSC
jgi:glycosyl hydrolase family 114